MPSPRRLHDSSTSCTPTPQPRHRHRPHQRRDRICDPQVLSIQTMATVGSQASAVDAMETAASAATAAGKMVVDNLAADRMAVDNVVARAAEASTDAGQGVVLERAGVGKAEAQAATASRAADPAVEEAAGQAGVARSLEWEWINGSRRALQRTVARCSETARCRERHPTRGRGGSAHETRKMHPSNCRVHPNRKDTRLYLRVETPRDARGAARPCATGCPRQRARRPCTRSERIHRT